MTSTNPLPDWLQIALQLIGGGGTICTVGYLAAKNAFGLIQKRKELSDVDAEIKKALREGLQDEQMLREKLKAKFEEQMASLKEELEQKEKDHEMVVIS